MLVDNAIPKIKSMLADNAITRIKAIKSVNNTAPTLCQVTGFDANTGLYTAIIPDGSICYFKYIGNAPLAIGEQVSITTPDKAAFGYGDTKAR
jgi:hypothetical protein